MLDILPEIGINKEMDPHTVSSRFEQGWVREQERTTSTNSTSRSSGAFVWCALALKRIFNSLKKLKTRLFGGDMSLLDSANHQSSSPYLVFALYPLVSGNIWRALVARMMAELIPVFIPILVKLTVAYSHYKRLAHQTTAHAPNIDGPPSWQGYLLAVGMFLMLIVYTWAFQWFYFEIGKATVIVRTALISALYRKSLVLSSPARTRLTLGQLNNLVSSDISQIERGITSMLVCITVPVQVVVSVAVLVYMIGPVSIAGWALVLSFVPIQLWASKYVVSLRKQAVKYTDERMRATRETLQGIKVVKYFAWEGSMLDTIKRIRSKEISAIAKLNILKYGLISFALHSPVFASILTFAVFALTGGELRDGPVFAVIGIFSSMSVPLSWFPGALTETRNSVVPLQRITNAMLEEDLNEDHHQQPNLDVAIKLNHAHFAWNNKAKTTTASDSHPVTEYGHTLESYRFPNNPFDQQSKDGSTDSFSLKNICLEIPHGSLVVIIGKVGCGKSSLISSLVGEMPCISGDMFYNGAISYAPQVPWISNASIRDNITFGMPYDREKYIDVIESCALDTDIASFPDGDLAEVGERGTTLSGGQKQRINIARAAYSESSIVLLDDCLSAVDTQVSRTIFRHCIKGILATKTRLLVTNSLDYIPAADYIVTLDRGRVAEQGTFNNLMGINGVTASMYNSYVSRMEADIQQAAEGHYTTDSSLHTATLLKETNELSNGSLSNISSAGQSEIRSITPLPYETSNSSNSNSDNGSNAIITEQMSSGKDSKYSENIVLSDLSLKRKQAVSTEKLMSIEERMTGQVSLSTSVAYIAAGGGYLFLVSVLLCLGISQGCRTGSDFWVRLWIKHEQEANHRMYYIGIYILLGGLQLIWFLAFAVLLVVTIYKSSKWLHNRALERVLKSPMSFFDTTPLGRIINRFTRDIDSIDLALCDFLRQFYQNLSRSIGAFVSISILIPVFLAPLLPLFAISWALIYVYLRTSIEIQRTASISRSPLYAHYNETLQGLATIRAYKAQERYIARLDRVLDDANRPHWYSLVVQNWVWLRVDYISHTLSFAVCLFIVSQPTRWDAAAVGLLLVQATQMGAYVTYAGRGWTELQNNMNALERINYYAVGLKQEEGEEGGNVCRTSTTAINQHAKTDWPERGTIIIRSLSMQYRPGLPLALQDMNMEIYDQERIGIVGRSGAGKSSITSALFRLVEPSGGKIFIDGVDIQSLELDRLRRAIGILPQDPVLFEGTLRTNLDPLHMHSDTEIWDILDKVCLRGLVSLHPNRLDMAVGEGGDNFSVGQRQLLCLARVLLGKPMILILDEATANVDHETDRAIQDIVLSNTLNMTVISIAHRLQTIINYDRIYVIDGGQVVESGTPLSLLEQHLQTADSDSNSHEPSVFYTMVREMDAAMASYMLRQARNRSFENSSISSHPPI